ncbi:MAG: autotransporter domain-containing protein, partial [Alphaproteobacteria bacterium]|nr:autotransporter domain-containing protein [Alphaproteobacteria bacterium]
NAKGGAIYNGENAEAIVGGASFQGNQSLQGGAIYNNGKLNVANASTSTFKDNTAGTGKGGAIYNDAKGVATIEKALFQNNQAAQGGAIYNSGKLTINNASTTAFKDNKATGGKGAAIYNASNGTVIIQGADDQIDLSYDPYLNQTDLNTGNPLPNPQRRLFGDNQDVYNEANATLTIQDSKLQLHHSKDLTKGVININKSKTGTVNINNSQIDVGKAAVYGDTINVNKGSEMLVHLNTKDGEKDDLGKNFGGLSANTISVSDDDTAITIRVKAGEHMDKEAGPKEFKILDAETLNDVDNTGFATITKNHMYDIKYKGDGVYELTKVRPICPNGGCVHNAWVESEGEMDGHTKAQQIRELLNDLAQKYGCESKLYRDALDGIAPDVSPLIQAQATEVTQRLHGIISKQLYASMDRTGYVHRGKRFYRFPERKSRVWIQGVYGQSEYAGDKGFDMDTEGIALGFDKHIGKDTKLGLAYTYSKSTGTAVQRDTDVEAHTVAVYGEYNPDRFYSNWLALYSRSSYEENKKVYTERVKAEYDVDVFGGQIMFGNKMGPFVVGDWASGVLSPEIGLRYTYIKQHGYTDSAGQKVSDADGHVLTGILGAQYTIGYTLTPSIAWYPELRAAITYDFLEPDLENSVTLVNGSRYDVVTENLDKFGIEIGARVGLDINRKAEIALEYEGVFKGDYTNHTGLASLKYKF